MAKQENEGRYRKRLHIAETPFACIKAMMGIRHFLTRGMDNVKRDWMWICSSYNMVKLVGKRGALCTFKSKMKDFCYVAE